MSQIALSRFIPLTAFHIKILAALLMVADHIGFVLEVEWLRIVGRFSFPLFVWLLSQGAKHTHNFERYERRLLILAIASQPIYSLFIRSVLPLNTVFGLWLSLVLYRLLQKRQMTFLLLIAIIGMATLFLDYGYYTIGLAYLVYSYPFLLSNSSQLINSKVDVILWVAAFALLHFYYALSHPVQLYALAFIGLLPFLSAIRERGAKARWFYWFYPLHFIPLIFLGVFLWHMN